ncbi:MAG: subfamily polymerase sigma-24 subunit [Acidobacteria bacterium]|nr:subfamily polymerase sigma-24 subunit [Acidobacteriota bacterium]
MTSFALQYRRSSLLGGASGRQSNCDAGTGLQYPMMLSSMSLMPAARQMDKAERVDEDDDFYETILAPMKGRMLRAVWQVVRNPQLVEDTLQDALAAIWRIREKIRSHPNPQALILKITTDISCDALRKSLRLQRREQPESKGESAIQLQDPGPWSFETAHFEMKMRRAIAALPEKQAVAVLLRIVHGQPYTSIAQSLGCSEPTARIHVMRGRTRLRRMLAYLVEPMQSAKGATK